MSEVRPSGWLLYCSKPSEVARFAGLRIEASLPCKTLFNSKFSFSTSIKPFRNHGVGATRDCDEVVVVVVVVLVDVVVVVVHVDDEAASSDKQWLPSTNDLS